MKKSIPIIIGLAWFSIGVMLLLRGLKLAIYFPNTWAATILGSWEKASLLFIASGLMIGFMKGRMVFRKAVKKLLQKLETHSPYKIFLRQLMIIPLMMGLGIFCAHILSKDILSILDVAVGTALIYGGWTIFLFLILAGKRKLSHESK